MTTLEKTIGLLNTMTEKQIEIIYTYAQFVEEQEKNHKNPSESVEDILNNLIGSVPDNGMTLEDFRKERILDKYGIVD